MFYNGVGMNSFKRGDIVSVGGRYRLVLDSTALTVKVYPINVGSTLTSAWFTKDYYTFVMHGPENLNEGMKLVNIMNKLICE